MICRCSRPVLVLHERKTRLTLMARLTGKTAAETVSTMMAVFGRLTAPMRGSITFDNDTAFARHALLRSMLRATTYFCDAYASWQKGGVENANGRLRRWLPRRTDLDAMTDEDIQEIAMTLSRHAAEMPRLPLADRGLPRRAWQAGRYPLPWPCCASRLNPPFEEPQRQVAVADLLILTKGDFARDPASRRDLAALRQRLATLNPNARLQSAEETTAGDMFSLAAFDPAGKPLDVRAWLRFDATQEHGHVHGHAHLHEAHGHSHDVNIHGATTAFCFSATGPIAPAALETAISALQAWLARRRSPAHQGADRDHRSP